MIDLKPKIEWIDRLYEIIKDISECQVVKDEANRMLDELWMEYYCKLEKKKLGIMRYIKKLENQTGYPEIRFVESFEVG